MNQNSLPPLPAVSDRVRSRNRWFRISLLVLMAGIVFLAGSRALGLLQTFKISTGGMSPSIRPGDRVLMEGWTYLFREPRRGEVVVFKNMENAMLDRSMFFVMRVAGLPGEELRLEDDRLWINGREVTLSNAAGSIVYRIPEGSWQPPHLQATVPQGKYFVLGDNSTNSLDSRYWGPLPRRDIRGRIVLHY